MSVIKWLLFLPTNLFGGALAGLRPVAEIMLMNFTTVAMDQIVNHAAKLRFMTHALAENRNGLVVDVETTKATGTAEREAAEKMAKRTLKPGSTLGADKGYDVAAHQKALKAMKIKPHTAAKAKGSAVDGRTQRSKGYAISLVKRKRIEECFGWAKTIGGFRKTRFIGTAKVQAQAQALLTFAAWNLTRMMTLLGWRESTGIGQSTP